MQGVGWAWSIAMSKCVSCVLARMEGALEKNCSPPRIAKALEAGARLESRVGWSSWQDSDWDQDPFLVLKWMGFSTQGTTLLFFRCWLPHLKVRRPKYHSFRYPSRLDNGTWYRNPSGSSQGEKLWRIYCNSSLVPYPEGPCHPCTQQLRTWDLGNRNHSNGFE